jgi:lysophospholipase L1-like esterase
MNERSVGGISFSRRGFVRTAGAAGAAAFAAVSSSVAQTPAPSAAGIASPSLIEPGDIVLFQGDSITDVGRNRSTEGEPNSYTGLGAGYARLAAAELLVDRLEDRLKFYNRGISGNKVYQLAERWDADCLALKPNVVSILIGVNDFWHKLKHGYDGTLEKYDADFRALLDRTKAALPDVRLVICEPFALHVGAVDASWFPEFDGYREAARKIAADVGAAFVPFQSMFDAATKFAPPEVWAADGVHPTSDGAALMAHAWLTAVGA